VLVDVVVALLMFGGGLGHILVHHSTPAGESTWIVIVLLAAAALPNAVRRFWPMPALACVIIALSVSTAMGSTFAPDPLIAPALYWVALNYDRRRSLLALAAVEGALLTALLVDFSLRPATDDAWFAPILAAATWFIGDSRRARQAYEKGLAEQAHQRQRDELDRAERSVEDERLQIARELHDVVAHSLSVIAVQSGMGAHVLDSQPEETRRALDAIKSTSRSALGELHRMLGVLRRNADGRLDLQPAPSIGDLRSLVEQISAAGVPVDLIIRGAPVLLPKSIELSAFRIVQEALTNVVKHAGCAHASVVVAYEVSDLVIEVTDDGIGQNAVRSGARAQSYERRSNSRPRADGHGIVGMRERTAIFGGTLITGPMDNGGYRVVARVPIAADR
jgi:signal transduction histidine kinase